MDSQNPTVSDKQIQSHHISILQNLDGFLSEYMVAEDFPSNIGSNWRPLRTDIRAVVLTGDASTKGFSHLKAVLQHVFGGLSPGWLKDSIDPSAVAAIGAAKMALHLVPRSGNLQMADETARNNHNEL